MVLPAVCATGAALRGDAMDFGGVVELPGQLSILLR